MIFAFVGAEKHMMLGYGEDALTLWGMTQGLPRFLRQLKDDTPPEEALVIFRPSFGRRSPNPNAIPSVFGEFDAIVRSRQANYLVEGKWNSSSELKKSVLEVAERQERRHRVMRWYYQNWQQEDRESWADFRRRSKASFEAAFRGLTMPTAGTTLAMNLEYILALMKEKELPLYDVLLFSTVHAGLRPSGVKPDSFRLVVLHVESIGGNGYIRMDRNISEQ